MEKIMEKRTVINTTIRVSFAVTPDLVCDGCEKMLLNRRYRSIKGVHFV